MSAIVRQSNLFAAEDFVKVYKSFQDINFTSYDFDTIRESLIEYIRVYYPEDFNDFTADSEFIAIIELLSYLGTSLAFRTDLNARENLLDTAERRESIVRLARMINYQPKRNIAANGLFKVKSVVTNEQVKDSVGNQLSGLQITWNDPNNPNWYNQFNSILNAALNQTNPFGKPSKSHTIGGIPTDLYAINSVLGANVAYNQSLNINGEEVPIDIVNPDIETTITERHPDQNEAFNLIYRNDSLGVGSANTGFFLKFVQGTLNSTDFRYDFPEPNRVQEVDIKGINNSDVFIQEINDQGTVVDKWQKVPSVNGTNIIYNSINFNERNIFEAISGLNDTVSVKFSDGNFGNVPAGIFRCWYRTSIGRNIAIRPEDANGLQLALGYFGKDGQRYTLVVNFGLENSIANGASAETNNQIKTRAPQTYYTQNRMVNNEDYNVFPLTFGNEIQKLRAINRTHSGHSRYIPLRDPTGFHDSITVLGEDGAIYNELKDQTSILELTSTLTGEVAVQASFALQDAVSNSQLENFFYSEYIPAVETAQSGIFALNDGTDIRWKTAPDLSINESGFFIKAVLPGEEGDPDYVTNWPYGSGNTGAYVNIQGLSGENPPYEFIKPGSTIKFVNPLDTTVSFNTSVVSVVNSGQAFDPVITETGPIQLGSDITDLWVPVSVSPVFRTVFREDELEVIQAEFDNSTSFALRYDITIDTWQVISSGYNVDSAYQYDNSAANWMMYVQYQPAEGDNNPFYTFVTRGIVTVFESLSSVRFYWNPDDVVIDSDTGRANFDKITVLSANTGVDQSVSWDLTGVFTESDGFQDTSKVEVSPTDSNEDTTADNPRSFRDIVDSNNEVVFERYLDIDGYQRSRPWLTKWVFIDPTEYAEINNESGPQFEAVLLAVANVLIDDIGLFYVNPDVSGGSVPVENKLGRYIGETPSITDINAELDYPPVGSIQALAKAYVNNNSTNSLSIFENKSFKVGAPGNGFTIQIGTSTESLSEYYKFATVQGIGEIEVVLVKDTDYYSRNGRSLTQNLDIFLPQESFFFKWNHYISSSQIVDPSSTNIIDMIVLTNLYYNDILVWKSQHGSSNTMPLAPTTENLRVQFAELNNFKSISDEIIFNSGKFKVLFGPQAVSELQATFKAVKIPTSKISDNELRTRIIQAVDQYFDINNWDFGEQFYYTELAAFIHTQLAKFLSSIVIVPKQADSDFGNLFEISARPSELFISTATVSDVEIVSNFTDANLRIK
jgi:hypothetical protein